MLSRLALRSGAFIQQNAKARSVLVLSTRGVGEEAKKMTDTWDNANKIYFGPERDTKNFPHPVQGEKPPPIRMGVFPESWFKAFYDKTGVTGPYMFGVSTIAFLLSKELWVVEHGFVEFIAFFTVVGYAAKKLGPGIANTLNDMDKQYREKHWNGPLQKCKDEAQGLIDETEKQIWQCEGQRYLFEAKRENVDLQLEGGYRQRVADAHKEVKNRLDYLVQVETTKRNFEQEHMVSWVVDQVRKSISPAQEKDSILQCINDLKAIAAAPKA